MILIFGILFGLALLVGGFWVMARIAREGTEDAFPGARRWAWTAVLMSPIIITFVMGHREFVRTGQPNAGIGIVGLFLVLVCGTLVAFLWTPRWGEILTSPITGALTGGDEEIEARPYYSKARGLSKRGQYMEALEEIELQLSRFPDDFEGLMLQAEIQAEKLHDLSAAMETLAMIENSSDRDPGERAQAMFQQAELLMKQPGSVAAACVLLQQIIEERPGTPAARVAQQRLAHMPSIPPESGVKPLVVVEHTVKIGLTADFGAGMLKAKDPAAQADELRSQLDWHPEDWDARERLALLYSAELNDPTAAREQLEVLLGQANVPDRKVAEWLNKLADIEIAMGDPLAARMALDRLMSRLPATSHAEHALLRRDKLGIEIRGQRPTPTLKLGEYEQNIGLKWGRKSGETYRQKESDGGLS